MKPPTLLLCALWLGLHPGLGNLPARAADDDARVPGFTPEIARILERMLAAYREARTYRDDGRLTILQESGRVRHITKMPSSVRFQRPNRLQVTGGMQTIACDGRQLQIVLDALRQYQQREAPAKLTMGAVQMGAPGAGLDEGFPEILEFLLGDDVLDRWLAQVSRMQLVPRKEPITIDGNPCHEIVYETLHKAKITLYVGIQSSLLVRCDMDYTEAQRPPGAPAGPSSGTLQYAYQLHPVVINEPIPEVSFALREVPDMRKVEEFTQISPGGVAPAGEDLAPSADASRGADRAAPQPLPEFRAADLAGKRVDQGVLSGKVALVFFWSPYGSADSLRSIPMVQRLANEFADRQDFCVLGVSLAGEDPALVKDLLAAKKANFRTIVDKDGALMRSFQVSVMPTFCLISRSGMIQDVLTGAPDEGEDALRSRVRKLLAD